MHLGTPIKHPSRTVQFGLLVALVALVGVLLDGRTSSRLELVEAIDGLPEEKRRWVDPGSWHPVLEARRESALIDIERTEEGTLLAISPPDLTLYRQSLGGTVEDSIRLPPTPDGFPIDVAAGPAGSIAVLVAGAERLLHSGAGSVFEELVLRRNAHRVVGWPSGGWTVLTAVPDRRLLTTYSLDGRIRSRFGRVVARDEQPPQVVQGSLATDGDALYYAPLYFNVLLSFRASGDERFAIGTIGANAPLATVVMRDGEEMVAPETPMRNLDVSARGPLVAILVHDAAASVAAVDFFRCADGAYVASVRATPGATSLAIDATHLYLAEERMVVRAPLPDLLREAPSAFGAVGRSGATWNVRWSQPKTH